MPDHAAQDVLAASALSDHIDTRTAATEIAQELSEQFAADDATASIDLLMVFASFHHTAGFHTVGEMFQQVLTPRAMIGCTAESVLGVNRELEGRAGLAALALRLPGVPVHAFHLPPDVERGGAALRNPRELAGVTDDTQAIVLLADPFTTPVPTLISSFESCRAPNLLPIPISGGIASGSNRVGHNVLLCDGLAQKGGLAGVSIGRGVNLDFVVSQGCKPVGEPMVITRAEGNVILEIGGRPAMHAIHDQATQLPEAERALLSRGLFIGVVINEYKERFGRGDFLIRNVLGFDKNRQAVAIADAARPGRTIQMHVRDAATAAEDLQLLLDGQAVKGAPFATAVFSCNGRGARLFGEANHDIGILRERFGEIAIAGFFAGGEIGPVGPQSFVHGHTLSALLFRDASDNVA